MTSGQLQTCIPIGSVVARMVVGDAGRLSLNDVIFEEPYSPEDLCTVWHELLGAFQDLTQFADEWRLTGVVPHRLSYAVAEMTNKLDERLLAQTNVSLARYMSLIGWRLSRAWTDLMLTDPKDIAENLRLIEHALGVQWLLEVDPDAPD